MELGIFRWRTEPVATDQGRWDGKRELRQCGLSEFLETALFPWISVSQCKGLLFVLFVRQHSRMSEESACLTNDQGCQRYPIVRRKNASVSCDG